VPAVNLGLSAFRQMANLLQRLLLRNPFVCFESFEPSTRTYMMHTDAFFLMKRHSAGVDGDLDTVGVCASTAVTEHDYKYHAWSMP